MLEIPDAGHRVGGRFGRVKAGADLLEAALVHDLRERGINLDGIGEQVFALGEGGRNPAIGRVVSARVAHHQGRFVLGRVVCRRAGGHVGLGKGDLVAVLVGVRAGGEDVQTLHAADDRQRMEWSLLNRGRKFACRMGSRRLWRLGQPGSRPKKDRRAFYKRLRRAREPKPSRWGPVRALAPCAARGRITCIIGVRRAADGRA